MSGFQIIAVLIVATALFSYANFRYLRLPTTIGVMLIALLVSICLIALGKLGLGFQQNAQAILRSVNFDQTMMQGMLSFLLFAGALHINLNDLTQQKGAKGPEETEWHASSSPEGRRVMAEWRSWRGPDGQPPVVCVP
jgi:CPA1 family monovalent cation:H+ antiporter